MRAMRILPLIRRFGVNPTKRVRLFQAAKWTPGFVQVRTLVENVMRQIYRHLPGGVSLVPLSVEPWSNSWWALVAPGR